MATIRYIAQGQRDTVNIYIRLRDGRETDIKFLTGITLAKDHWSKAKNWISPKATFHNKLEVENDLRELETIVHGERNKQIAKGLTINRDWLETVIRKWQGKQVDGIPDNLIGLIENYKTTLPNRIRNGKKGVSIGTIKTYNTTIQRLKKFEKAIKRTYKIAEVDLSFYDHYLKHARTKLSLSENSIGRDIKNIKAVCNDAKEKGFVVNDQILSRNFSAPSEKTLFTTLNEVELERIKNFTGSNYLENARDWLLIGCWTGCRVGDLMKLTVKNITTHTSGTKVIQYTQSKGGKLVNVPMHDDVHEIIERLKGFPRSISSTKFNEYIKKVCKLSGLTYEIHGTRQNPETHLKETGKFEKWQLIKSHTCRRSFATNHYNKMPNKVIMMVTGHATEKMLLAYIGETEVEHIDDFVNLWSNQQKDKSITKSA